MSNFLLSVIIPVFNEEKNISALIDRLNPILKAFNSEIIFVDDGSKDETVSEIKKVAQHNKNIKLVSFYRNFGHQPALMAGYMNAKGDAVITLDADLQDPPEIIPEMIEAWENGAKVVYAKRKKREVDTFFKKTTAHMFYSFMNFLSDVPIPNDVGDFRLLDREVVTFLNSLPEHSRFLRGLVAWGGHPADFVYFERAARHSGETHYTFSKMLNFALEGITSFSTKPLRIASYLGFIAAVIGFVAIIYTLIGKLLYPEHYIWGWTGLFVGIVFLGGVQLFTIGIIGEYIGKIYQEVQNRPHYMVKEKINL